MESIKPTLLDERQYRKLLAEALPVAIRAEQEYRRLLRASVALMEKPQEEISEEEGRLLELLSISAQRKSMKPNDLWTVLTQKPRIRDFEREAQHQ